MESAAALDAWLHEQGYTYHGDAPITGLTTLEYDKLQLGYVVRQEQKEKAADNARHEGTVLEHYDVHGSRQEWLHSEQ